ncbi:hypothetical protein OSG_eHP23_00075 [environmental Halophage eHP-23]|nr:hypothetical protein OSG_eHP23_00075 [environmental Halophage eHP-23]AFH22821.1 hypothetical protein OSG_eHP35_00185 [environmental Halophage eHP-35]
MFTIVLESQFSDYSVDIQYEFDLVQRKEDGRTREFTTIPLQDPEAARHFGFQPGQSNPTIEWTLYDNGEDKSNGSLNALSPGDDRFTSTDSNGNPIVKTVEEQIIWLTEYIHDNTSDPRWTLIGGRFSDRNGDGIDEGTKVVLKDTQHRRIAGLNAARGTVNLKLGVTV